MGPKQIVSWKGDAVGKTRAVVLIASLAESGEMELHQLKDTGGREIDWMIRFRPQSIHYSEIYAATRVAFPGSTFRYVDDVAHIEYEIRDLPPLGPCAVITALLLMIDALKVSCREVRVHACPVISKHYT